MKNQISGAKCRADCISVTENGITDVVYICRTGLDLESFNSGSTKTPVSAGMMSRTNGWPGPFSYLHDSMNGFVQILDGYQTEVYIQSLQSVRLCGR